MSKIRLLVLLITFFIVGTFATLISLYARGYRFNSQNLAITPNGLLVAKSVPDGAQIYIDGELKTATNATLPLGPGTYDVSIRKEGFISWNKRMTIEKEIVTETTAHLFKSTPSLSALTFAGATNPTPSRDFTKIAYTVLDVNTPENTGIWVIETVNLPLGFARDPRRITDGIHSESTYIWSPTGDELMLTTSKGTYLLPTSTFTSQSKLVNIEIQREKILTDWQEEKQKLTDSQLRKLPEEVKEILSTKAAAIMFSPDEEMILYSASSEATLKDKLIPQLPGASTQKQERTIKAGKTYIYDIKEDRNFLIDEDAESLQIEGGFADGFPRRLTWYPSSRNLVLAEPNNILIMDYDGSNRQTVYAGSYFAPNALPTLSLDRLLILTNLGATNGTPNLYSLSLK